MSNTLIHKSARIYGNSQIAEGSCILEDVILGYPDAHILNKMREQNLNIEDCKYLGVIIGRNALVRSKTVIYCNVRIGDNFRAGHNVLIRENTIIGDGVLIGTNGVVEGNTTIGTNVSIQSNVYIPSYTTIEDLVFIGPNAVLTNDRYPIRKDTGLKGPVIRKGASIGANATILPGVEVGEKSMVAAGAVVTKDVPEGKLAIGTPAKMVDLPQYLRVLNRI